MRIPAMTTLRQYDMRMTLGTVQAQNCPCLGREVGYIERAFGRQAPQVLISMFKMDVTGREETTMSMTIKPLADRVLVEPLEGETMKGGIIIPDTAKEKPQQGKVIAVGPGRTGDDGKRIAPEVKKGDTVLYGKYSGTEVSVTGKDYLILREGDILAIL
jgi:chaperonin GroES